MTRSILLVILIMTSSAGAYINLTSEENMAFVIIYTKCRQELTVWKAGRLSFSHPLLGRNISIICSFTLKFLILISAFLIFLAAMSSIRMDFFISH